MASGTIKKQTDFEYKEITCTTTSEKVDSIFAFVENGLVFMEITAKAGLNVGWHNDIVITMPDKYRPRRQIYGTRRITAGADAGKIAFANWGGTYFQLYIAQIHDGICPFQFVYPLKSV